MTKKKSPPEVGLRQKALNLLARREYSGQELRRRLAAGGHDPDEIESLVTNFAEQGWLSDQRFAEQVVANRSRQYGQRRIAQELRDKGVGTETIAAALEGRTTDDEQLARALWLKKFGTAPATPQDKARQVRFLQARGFGLGLILRVIGGRGDDDLSFEETLE